ncbi:MAG: DUF6364 family protein [Actinobacteria bacterium]|nr:DUF6364 family protein [Actinomycetota bacterium]
MKKERLTIVLNPELRKRIKIKAAERDVTVSEVVEGYLKNMLEKEELEEDIALSKFAEEREKTYTRQESLAHDDVWR